MTIPFDRSFGYIFKSPRWVSTLLIGAGFSFLSFLLIGLPFLNGYLIKLVRFRLKGSEDLPDWSDLGQIFVDGMKFLLVAAIHTLPFVLIAGLVFLGNIVVEENETAGLILLLAVFPLQVLLMFYSVWLALVYLFIYYVIASDLPLSHAFHHGKFWRVLKQDWANALLALLFSYLGGIISSLGFLAFIVGWFFTLPYYIMVSGDIYGRLLKHWQDQKLLA